MLVPLLVVAAACAVVDWWAVAADRRPVERIAKPATMAVLVVVAATGGDVGADVRQWVVVGAILGLVGDVALLGAGDVAFVVGLASFAVGHVAYVVASIATGFDVGAAVVGAVTAAMLVGFRFVGRIVPGARQQGGTGLAAAVAVYGAIISVMLITAWGTGIVVAGIGATLFAASDWILGYQRFVDPLWGRRLSVMIPYHVGQALLIVGLVTQ